MYAQNLFVKKYKIGWFEIVLITSFTLLLKRVNNLVVFEQVKKTTSHSSDFEQVKNLLIIFDGFISLLVIFAAFEQVKNTFRRNSATYGTPCHAIAYFPFWYHHVTKKTPWHASGHLVIYHECYGLRKRFLLSGVLYLTLLPAVFKASPGRQFNLKVSRASCGSSKHSPGPTLCLNHSNPQ